MIRVRKSTEAPASLASRRYYKGEDVLGQLDIDQDSKCYICERKRCTDFQVEHHKSRDNHPELTYEWNNLFWACGYCNGKKQSRFDNMLDPARTNIEQEICQQIDFGQQQVCIDATIPPTPQLEETIRLLRRVFNGTGTSRRIREKKFYHYVEDELLNFATLLLQWMECPTEDNRQLVAEQLGIEEEFLGLKYWMVQSNAEAAKAFAPNMIWNKI